ncbi:MAG TPA: site-specific integrase [Sphingobacterium sp.]|nr:site-specific integrase [Sphingobacterium sp.]
MSNVQVSISNSSDLKKRAYVYIKIENKKYKEYTGGKLGLDLKPNSCETTRQRDEVLKTLEYEFRKAIEFGNYPIERNTNSKTKGTIAPPSLEDLLDLAIENKKKANLTSKYVNQLQRISNKLKDHLSDAELKGNINDLSRQRIQEFINLFNSSASHYMIIRRHLKALFSEIDKDFRFDMSIVNRTDRRKATPTLHKIYSDKQLKEVLKYLKTQHENLYLCCLISYGCLLRPHNEIRNLTCGHFKNDFTEIHLSGAENKGKKIRTVPIPNYIREQLMPRLENLGNEINIFSMRKEPKNQYYFSTAWTRMFKLMEKKGIIEKNQTIYSFRHTAAVNVYKKTKDLHILQQLLGHSDMIVTLKYLRGLGVHNMDELKHVMPEL